MGLSSIQSPYFGINDASRNGKVVLTDYLFGQFEIWVPNLIKFQSQISSKKIVHCFFTCDCADYAANSDKEDFHRARTRKARTRKCTRHKA